MMVLVDLGVSEIIAADSGGPDYDLLVHVPPPLCVCVCVCVSLSLSLSLSLVPPPRSWSLFVGICLQKLTKFSKIDS